MKNHDIVIHLAAKTDVIDSIHNPDDTFQTNVQGTQNVLDSCKSHMIFQKLLLLLHAAVYKNSDNSVDESSPTQTIVSLRTKQTRYGKYNCAIRN